MNDRLEILARLLKEDKITLDEFKLLMDKEITYVPTTYPSWPLHYWESPVIITPTITQTIAPTIQRPFSTSYDSTLVN